MARKKFAYTQNVLLKSGIKVGAAVGTNYGMAFLDKSIPVLAKNQWITPISVFGLSLFGMAMTPQRSFGRDAFDGMNIMAGVDMVNSFVDIAKQNMPPPALERVVDGKKMGKTKNPGVGYVNMARG